MRLAEMFGPVEDRKKDERAAGAAVEVALVSNETVEGVTDEMNLHSLHLKANQQWHIDSTFMPVPSLCNILTAKVVTSEGGQTELASTRAAWAAMPDRLKARIRGKNPGAQLPPLTRADLKRTGRLANVQQVAAATLASGLDQSNQWTRSAFISLRMFTRSKG